ncbi:peptide chain release factor N(5)-glutamine methyltransferase [Muriicola soli]|uniref:peptide chain release factor N(5)-glutamine methyltransferase n=1 Tax=Muriicola soli TaxID=2507538 RepID=A0A411EA95_9FLAO|nr:peptide chain release factor N(5)-glutamine methyltransferase [Muriicola soli]QBA64380.1 peptide chain release factor N(5)-glutamine methyltransferase [Muriicola soli]
MLLKEIKHIFHKELDQRYGSDEVDHFFYYFIEHYLELPKFHLALHPEWIITKEEEGVFFRGLSALKQGQPLQYVLGITYFMDLPIKVNKNVLIPRPETEELVRRIIKDYKDFSGPLRILDIGTGSGCIALSLSKYLPDANIKGIDLSPGALKMAKENARLNELDVEWVESDIRIMNLTQDYYDIIVSNPPYVLDMEKSEMEEHVKEAEPPMALFVPDDKPLVFYEYIVREARKALVEGGAIYLEINQRFGKEVSSLLKDHNFESIELSRDLHGRDRYVKAINSKK